MRQSQRGAIYADAIGQLERAGRTYPCYCTRREIREAASAPHSGAPELAYPGTCRNLTRAQRAEREAAGRRPALRLRAGAARIGFDDIVAGPQGGVVDDFVLRRADGVPAYNLAVAVDDSLQGVGEVVRGEDLLASTPRQLLVLRLLGLRAPRYGHVPLVVGADGARLAKRHGAVTLADRLARGETAADVVGRLAHSAGLTAEPAPVLAPQLVEAFDAGRIVRRPAALV